MDLTALYIFLLWVVCGMTQDEDWTKKCNKCSCIWAKGKRTANCVDKGLNAIPQDMSDIIREIDFSNNPIYTLGKDEFSKANLRDLHKLKLQNCSIKDVNELAFNRLALLIELDLSRNEISVLHKNIFRPNIKLRILILSHNKISVLEEGMFSNLVYLQRISLDSNEIRNITSEMFQNLPALSHISLENNKIQRITFDLKKNLHKLSSLDVAGNPWICDCHLQEFRNSTIKNNLITAPTQCQSPPRLKGRLWHDATISFACPPRIVSPEPYFQLEATSPNVTLSCKVTGDPTPDVDWTNNGRIIERDPRKNKQRYFVQKDSIDGYTWNNLTITDIKFNDRGEYKCVAKNPGGEDDRNVTLIVPPGPLVGGGVTGPISTTTYWIVGLAIGFIAVLLIVLAVLFCFCGRKSTRGLNGKRREHTDSSEEYINMGSGQGDIKKGLITDVNPVTKPPRTTVSPSVVSGGTEVSDVKKNLLDNDSVFECDDESRSLDFDQPLLRKSQAMLESPEYRLNNHYPPDLLPFPPRGGGGGGGAQVSPAASSASTVAVADAALATRLPSHHGPQSPLHSPIYDQLNLYRTLPYSRSHSPFVGGGVGAPPPPRVPRQGYVTIPRRPRQQSWSSEPPNMSELIAEPLYDNLGLRTTADGGLSSLSLNKVCESPTSASTPRSNRMMFPTTPTGGCDTIAESQELNPQHHQQQPTMTSRTLPRNLNSKLTPSRTTQWAMANAEALRTPEDRRSTTSLPSPPGGDKPTKVPPRPPPKPKKRVSTGPLFEDEGEDGTEV